MTSVLVLVDIQRDYFPGGNLPLVAPDDAADRAASLLEHFRASGLPVIHVRHEGEPDAGFLVARTAGAEFDDRVAPRPSEPVVVKKNPNAFLDTPLQEELDRYEEAQLVVAGMMTSMCVDATVRAASDLGFPVTVAADACAAPDLAYGGTTVPGAMVHAAFIAALGSAYARVQTVEEITASTA
ncbi:cysteine hydrolase family protein [Microbacterium sp. P01]|uniref:cysteine hydrolase family protein n=1 Tax=unclassified Microbacterium TaxID=2609290 RepID=UPI00366C9844